jgi:hypothetical protein
MADDRRQSSDPRVHNTFNSLSCLTICYLLYIVDLIPVSILIEFQGDPDTTAIV